MSYFFPIVTFFASGVVVGGAYISFVTLLNIVPRLIQLTDTYKYRYIYDIALSFSTWVFTIIYFSDFNLRLSNIVVAFIGLFSGIFLGIFSSALAETLNVLPIISKKFKIKKEIKLIFYTLALGKMAGALYYFIFKIGG